MATNPNSHFFVSLHTDDFLKSLSLNNDIFSLYIPTLIISIMPDIMDASG